ncbi:MAG: peptidylprolyl isomerase, partial [Actinobacteria bacterium]|nr:peptidylprolyl isomerase [Actinomycetota bacterium]
REDAPAPEGRTPREVTGQLGAPTPGGGATPPRAAAAAGDPSSADESAATPTAGTAKAPPGGARVDDATPVSSSATDVTGASTLLTPRAALLAPSLASDTAPGLYRVQFTTTKGDFVVEVHRSWAPNGADRLYNLAKIGFFTDVAFFRVMKNFVVQFGIHGDPAVSAAWLEATIDDDAVSESNTRGVVSFADRRSPNTRTTQLFINLAGMNSYLDEDGYAPVGRVVDGMDVVDALHSGYGDGSPRGSGPSQAEIQSQGNEHLKRDFPNLDYILSAAIVE